MKRTVAMDMQRFKDLAGAYGGNLARWPEAERDAARVLAADLACRQILAEAGRLDEALDFWRVPTASSALRTRLVNGVPSLQLAAQRPSKGRGFGFWLSSAGLAAAGMAGVLCGVAVSGAALADARDEALVASATSDGLGSLNKLPDQVGRADGQFGKLGRP